MTIAMPWPFNNTGNKSQSLDAASATTKPESPFLHHYATPGTAPPSARINPKLKAQERRPVRLWHLWKYGLVVASKGM